jgi:hypothetical protein
MMPATRLLTARPWASSASSELTDVSTQPPVPMNRSRKPITSRYSRAGRPEDHSLHRQLTNQVDITLMM